MTKQEFIDLELKPYAGRYVDEFDWEGVWHELFIERNLIRFNGDGFEWEFPDIDALIDALKHNDLIINA